MANLNLAIIVRAVDKLTAPVRRITAATGRLTDAVRRAERPARNLTERQRGLCAAVVRATRSLAAQQQRLRSWGNAARDAAGRAGVLGRRAALGLGALAYGFKRVFIDTAAAFERYETQLQTIEGSSEKARKSMEWIENFAGTTPFEIGVATESFVRLRSYGLDPTDGSLRTLGDTAAAMGKPLIQAVEAIAAAVTGENERLKELTGIKGRAIKGGKIQYEYTVDDETKFVEVLANDRAQIQQTLLDIMNRKFGGGMDLLSTKFMGVVSNLMDKWTIFVKMVMQSGPFELITDRLRTLLDTISRMAADGSLQRLAERVGERLVEAFRAAEQAIRQIWPWVVRIGKALAWAAEKMGGWGNLALTLAGLYIAKPFISLTGALQGVAAWSGKALAGVRKLTGVAAAPAAAARPAGISALAGATGGLFPGAAAKAAPAAGVAAKATGFARFSGVLKVLAGLLGIVSIKFIAIGAVVAGLVYKYWEPIKAFFERRLGGLHGGFTARFRGAQTLLFSDRRVAPAADRVVQGAVRPGQCQCRGAGKFRRCREGGRESDRGADHQYRGIHRRADQAAGGHRGRRGEVDRRARRRHRERWSGAV